MISKPSSGPCHRIDPPQTSTSRSQHDSASGPGEPAADAALKLNALAQVTNGIAPAFSDLLTVIRGQTSLLLDHPGQDRTLLDPLRQIFTAAEKAGSLLRQLQIFSGQQVAHIQPLDLNSLIAEQIGVLHQLLGEDHVLDFQLAPELPSLAADAGMLEQILIILVLNAREATPRGGNLCIETERLEITPETLENWPQGRPGPFVVLRVDDSGPGIESENLSRIFEPFFTTKSGGRSVGLGLATVGGIVKQHHGWVTAHNREAGGTRVQIVLPAAPAVTASPARNTPTETQSPENQTILVVEDDVLVRDFIVTVLKEHGFRVLQAGSGPDALEVWRWHASRIQLLLTDMVLEDGMNGLQLASQLRAESPRLKVICTTGHLLEALQDFPEYNPDYRYLQKPCRPQAVVNEVRNLLTAS